jgi:hypothetical protein
MKGGKVAAKDFLGGEITIVRREAGNEGKHEPVTEQYLDRYQTC